MCILAITVNHGQILLYLAIASYMCMLCILLENGMLVWVSSVSGVEWNMDWNGIVELTRSSNGVIH